MGGVGVFFIRDVINIWGFLTNFWEVELEEVQDNNEEAEMEETIVEEDECSIINIFKLFHNPTILEVDDDDDDVSEWIIWEWVILFSAAYKRGSY